MKTLTEPLAHLREAISELDGSILELLRRRMELAAEIGRIKTDAEMPIVDRGVEEGVLRRVRQHAASCGVSEETLAAVFQAILQSSVERQHRQRVEMLRRGKERVLVLGGAGGMGGWVQRFGDIAGHRVELVDPAFLGAQEAGRFAALGEVADLDEYTAIVLAVPLGNMPQALAEVVARRPRGVVIEISSVKAHLADTLAVARAAGVRVISLHPMFGPGKSLYEPLTFLLAVQEDAEVERLESEPFLCHPFIQLVAVPFAHHDRLIAWILGLSHLTNFLFGAGLVHSGLDPAELRRCASTTFNRQLATALTVMSEKPGLYLDIQRLNPHRAEVYGTMREGLDFLERLIETGDRERFAELLAAGRQAVDP